MPLVREGLANFGTCRELPERQRPPRRNLQASPPTSTHTRGLKPGCTRADGSEGTVCPAANRGSYRLSPVPRGVPLGPSPPPRPSAPELPQRVGARQRGFKHTPPPSASPPPCRAPTCPGGRSSWSVWCCGRCRRLCRRNPSPPPIHRVTEAAHFPLS